MVHHEFYSFLEGSFTFYSWWLRFKPLHNTQKSCYCAVCDETIQRFALQISPWTHIRILSTVKSYTGQGAWKQCYCLALNVCWRKVTRFNTTRMRVNYKNLSLWTRYASKMHIAAVPAKNDSLILSIHFVNNSLFCRELAWLGFDK